MAKSGKIFKRYLLHEIEIDFKACTYFFCVVFFYSMVQICHQTYSVKILTLTEMILTNYVICYIQVYVFDNFDESDKFGRNEISGIAVCTALYAAVSWLFDWFGGSIALTALFAAFVILCYICVILCYIVKRRLDTRQLNHMLELYKQNEGRDE